MNRNIKKFLAGAMIITMTFGICSCGKSGSKDKKKSALDPDKPATVTVWNYYNGDQLDAFDKLVDEFNGSLGKDKGIVVVSVSQGDIATLADALLESADGKAGAQELPTLASVYSETAYILDKKNMLVAMDSYFTDEDLKKYVPAFIDEGRFNKNNDLMLFPISKSTELFTVNETDWNTFAADTGVTLESIKTQEDLVAAAEKYYEWTDSLTPDIREDGKALYGRDSTANYIYIGSNELGHELFNIKNGEMNLDMDKDTFKKLWDNYYIPYINGYFGAYAKFRSEDAKTGKILALTSSTSSTNYLPSQVTLSDDSTHDITMYTTDSLKFKDAVNDVVVQQGASFCMLKATEAQQEGAVEFLKWFTEPDRNMKFSMLSGYSPVTTAANTKDAIEKAYDGDTSTEKGKNVLAALLISADVYTNKIPYACKPFEGSKDVRSILGNALSEKAEEDRKSVEQAIAAGQTREEAVKQFSTDEYFEEWFDQLCVDVKKATNK